MVVCSKHLMKHMNLLPLDSHGVDFSRVRMWSLNNWSKFYRQTLLFGALQDPQINSVFNKHCVNAQGQVSPEAQTRLGHEMQELVASDEQTMLPPKVLLPGRWP